MGMNPTRPKHDQPNNPDTPLHGVNHPHAGNSRSANTDNNILNAAPVQNTTPESPKNQNTNYTPKNDFGGWISQIKRFVSFTVFVGGVLIAASLINQFIFKSYFVEGTSMVPTLQHNDRLIVERVGKTASAVMGKPYIPGRGAIVVLDSSIVTLGGNHEQLIKRVIGLPGDTIKISDGKVLVYNQQEPNGFNVDERLGLDLEQTYSNGEQEFEVPENHVFVMGDNRTQNGSHDSRAFGPVPAYKLEGRLWARILPVDQAKIFSALQRLGPPHTYLAK